MEMSQFNFISGLLFGLHFLSNPCEGQIYLPNGQETLFFAPGSNAKIEWTFGNNISDRFTLFWDFYDKNSSRSERIAQVLMSGDRDPEILKSSLPGVEVKKPATLILKNVDLRYEGRYLLSLFPTVAWGFSQVTVVISDEVAPEVLSVKSLSKNAAILGQSVVIMCEVRAVPLPAYQIIHNGTKIVRYYKTYIIPVVNYNHAGSYKCLASNRLGNSSKTFELSVVGTSALPHGAKNENSDAGISNPFLILVILVAGIVLGILLACLVMYLRPRLRKSKKPQKSPEPHATGTVNNSVYQDLDLTKMNSEQDYYQSLKIDYVNEDKRLPNKTGPTLDRDKKDYYQNLT